MIKAISIVSLILKINQTKHVTCRVRCGKDKIYSSLTSNPRAKNPSL